MRFGQFAADPVPNSDLVLAGTWFDLVTSNRLHRGDRLFGVNPFRGNSSKNSGFQKDSVRWSQTGFGFRFMTPSTTKVSKKQETKRSVRSVPGLLLPGYPRVLVFHGRVKETELVMKQNRAD